MEHESECICFLISVTVSAKVKPKPNSLFLFFSVAQVQEIHGLLYSRSKNAPSSALLPDWDMIAKGVQEQQPFSTKNESHTCGWVLLQGIQG